MASTFAQGDPEESVSLEGTEVLAALPEWWAHRARTAGLEADWTDWQRALPTPPVPLHGPPEPGLSAVDPHALGEGYTRALRAPTRLRHGRHYTPESLATTLREELERAGVPPDGVIRDPACGAGALLLHPPTSLRAESGRAAPLRTLERAAARFSGHDLDPLAAWMGNAILAAELLPLWAKLEPLERRPLPRLLAVADGLEAPTSSASVMVMNPPFGRTSLDRRGRARYARSLYGHANRFALFLHAAVEQTAPGGLIGAVLPTGLFGGAYYKRLRGFLAEEAPLRRLATVGERSGLFAGGVLQETCLAVFERAARPRAVACSIARLGGRPSREHVGHFHPAADPEQPWLFPRAPRDRRLVRRAAASERPTARLRLAC